MDRRDWLKTFCVAAGSSLVGKNLMAKETEAEAGESMAVLVDTTKCLGCRMCERACAQANGLPEPPREVPPGQRETSPTQWTVVSRFETEQGRVTVKRQCMHCLQPACASACLTKAMLKTPEGPVIWRGDKCMGCRFCMVSCPFDVPKFEYDSANPRIQKCVMCWERLAEGELPACVQNCPAHALQFGRRSEILEEAWSRIYAEPEKYVHHVYGEREAGGTSFLYLSKVPFEQIGFPANISETAYPVLTKEFLYAVPVVLTLVPPLLLAAAKSRNSGDASEEPAPTESEG